MTPNQALYETLGTALLCFASGFSARQGTASRYLRP